ncbi:MAG: DUF2809 domain-containing protein [Bacteroidales bacterium]
MKRNRILYLILLTVVMVSGLLSRKYETLLPSWLNDYLGDSLWAAMIFVGFAFLFPKKNSKRIAIISLAFCYLIEISQLYQADWINAVRQTTLGGLVLGFGFLWSDIVAYTIGVAASWLLEIAFFNYFRRNNH